MAAGRSGAAVADTSQFEEVEDGIVNLLSSSGRAFKALASMEERDVKSTESMEAEFRQNAKEFMDQLQTLNSQMSEQISRLSSRVNFASSAYTEELRAGVDRARVQLVLDHLDSLQSQSDERSGGAGGGSR